MFIVTEYAAVKMILLSFSLNMRLGAQYERSHGNSSFEYHQKYILVEK